MTNKALPTTYSLEVYEDSFVNDPSYYIESTTPFSGLNVGDYFSHRLHDGWHNTPNTENQKFIVSEIEHIIYTIEGVKNTQKIMICLKVVSYDWEK
jgi:hypothetical protein